MRKTVAVVISDKNCKKSEIRNSKPTYVSTNKCKPLNQKLNIVVDTNGKKCIEADKRITTSILNLVCHHGWSHTHKCLVQIWN